MKEHTLTDHISFYNFAHPYQDGNQNIPLTPPIKVNIQREGNNSVLFIREIILDKNSALFCPECCANLTTMTIIASEFFDKFFMIKIRLHPNNSYEISDKERLPEVLGIDYELSLALVEVVVQEVLMQLIQLSII